MHTTPRTTIVVNPDTNDTVVVIKSVSGDVLFHDTFSSSSPNQALREALAQIRTNQISLAGADFEGWVISGTRLAGLNLAGADFSHSQLTDVDFSDATITNADFGYSQLTDVDFSNANITNADFSCTKLTNVAFAEVRGGCCNFSQSKTMSPRANISFRNAYLKGAKFVEVFFTKAVDFTNSTLTDAKFDHALCFGTKFGHAVLSGASFCSATLEDVNAGGSDWTNTNLAFAKVGGGVWTQCKLGGANLSGVVFAGFGEQPFFESTTTGAKIHGHKLVGRHPITMMGPIGSRNDRIICYNTECGLYFDIGCQYQITEGALLARIEAAHGDNQHGQQYRAFIEYAKIHASIDVQHVD